MEWVLLQGIYADRLKRKEIFNQKNTKSRTALHEFDEQVYKLGLSEMEKEIQKKNTCYSCGIKTETGKWIRISNKFCWFCNKHGEEVKI